MRKQPGLYSDTGNMARDLLHQDYMQQPPIHHLQRWLDWRVQLLLESKEIVPGLTAALRFVVPHRRSSMVELQYFHGYAGIKTGITLSKKPIVDFSFVLGNRFINIATDISLDTKTAMLAKCDAGLSLNSSILNASLTMIDKGHSLKASSHLSMNFLRNSALAAEMTHRFLSNQTTITLGTQISPTPSTLVKARVGIDGTVAALLQQELFPAFFVSIEGAMNIKAAKRSARVGLTCALKYKMRQI